MNARIPLAAVSAALVLLWTPVALEAARPPVLGLNPPNERSIDSDPWMPDNHEPSVALRVTRSNVVVAEEPPAAVRPRDTWYRSVLTILRLLRIGGIVR